MRAVMVPVRCAACGWKSERMRREDVPAFGHCSSCAGEMRPQTRQADRRAAKAKADLAHYERLGA